MFTEIEQQTLDIDWFFLNKKHICFVASGGGKLPLSIAESSLDNATLVTYFRNLDDECDIIINPNLDENLSNEKYLSDFIHMSKKGLYAFDKTILNDFSDTNYHLVTTPLIPLTLNELPENIQDILRKTNYIENLDNINNIDISVIS
ncbi:hypothetical protein [Flavobacterium sp.]|uniref:hypothetical protein n=1 Tax=Flavobacterium sp. TaxID=239 RepID=UPI0037500B2B